MPNATQNQNITRTSRTHTALNAFVRAAKTYHITLHGASAAKNARTFAANTVRCAAGSKAADAPRVAKSRSSFRNESRARSRLANAVCSAAVRYCGW